MTTEILRTPELREAFERDWVVYGLTLAEMAAMYGYRDVRSVSRTAARLGLPKRPGGRKPGSVSVRLVAGRWAPKPGNPLVRVWVPDEEGAA